MQTAYTDLLRSSASVARPQLRQNGSAAPLSPWTNVKARIRNEHEDDAAQPIGEAAPQNGRKTVESQRQARAPADEDGSSATTPGGSFQSSMRQTAAAAAASAPKHWLDRHFPKARQWLQQKNIQWWLRGVQARCK